MFPQTLGMFVPALIMLLLTNKKEQENYFIDKKTYLNMIPGCFQAVGNLFLIISILVNTNAVASPLSEFSIVVATLLGMFYLKEKKPKPFNTITLIGLTLIFTGALLCGFSDFILKIK
jgi:glucose uptake protein GlcU